MNVISPHTHTHTHTLFFFFKQQQRDSEGKGEGEERDREREGERERERKMGEIYNRQTPTEVSHTLIVPIHKRVKRENWDVNRQAYRKVGAWVQLLKSLQPPRI